MNDLTVTNVNDNLAKYSLIDSAIIEKYKTIDTMPESFETQKRFFATLFLGVGVSLLSLYAHDTHQIKSYSWTDFTYFCGGMILHRIIALICIGAAFETKDFAMKSEKKQAGSAIIFDMVKKIFENSIKNEILSKEEVESLSPKLFLKTPKLLHLEFLLNDISIKPHFGDQDEYEVAKNILKNEYDLSKDIASLIKSIRLDLCGSSQELSVEGRIFCVLINRMSGVERMPFAHKSLNDIIYDVVHQSDFEK